MDIVKKADAKNIIIRLSRAILSILPKITGGRIDLQYDARTTTVGRTIYVGTSWETKTTDRRAAELVHEMEHVAQWDRYNILYPTTYLLSVWSLILPIILALLGLPWWCAALSVLLGCLLPGPSLRAYWEYKAFKETIYLLHERKILTVPEQTWYYARTVCGSSYYFAGLGFEKIVLKAFKKYVVYLSANGR